MFGASGTPIAVLDSAATVAADVSFLASVVDAATNTTRTFVAVAFGTAAADRRIVAAFVYHAGTLRNIVAITIGGVAASVKAIVANSATAVGLAIAIADVPTGTSGDIVIQHSGAVAGCGLAAWRVTGISTQTVHDSVTASAAAGDDMTGDLDVPADGVLIAAEGYWREAATATLRQSGGCANVAATASNFTVSVTNVTDVATWTGVTENYDEAVEANPILTQAFAAVSWI